MAYNYLVLDTSIEQVAASLTCHYCNTTCGVLAKERERRCERHNPRRMYAYIASQLRWTIKASHGGSKSS
jgi:hypothetical protein